MTTVAEFLVSQVDAYDRSTVALDYALAEKIEKDPVQFISGLLTALTSRGCKTKPIADLEIDQKENMDGVEGDPHREGYVRQCPGSRTTTFKITTFPKRPCDHAHVQIVSTSANVIHLWCKTCDAHFQAVSAI
jgi:hypothetical protein